MNNLLNELGVAKENLRDQGIASSPNATAYSGLVIGISNQLLAESQNINTQKIIESNEKLAEKGTYLTWALIFVGGVQVLATIAPHITSLFK